MQEQGKPLNRQYIPLICLGYHLRELATRRSRFLSRGESNSHLLPLFLHLASTLQRTPREEQSLSDKHYNVKRLSVMLTRTLSPRPTVEQRSEILKQLNASIESAKNQVRTARTEGFKLVGGKDAQGGDNVQKLANDYGGELDGLLGSAKKELDK